MNNPEPTIRVNVDVTNPGQFFACCGLLELADRLWPGAEGWFQENQFCIAASGSLSEIIHGLKDCQPCVCSDEGEPSINPVKIEKFNLKLNWWLRDDWSRFRDKPKEKRGGLMKSELKFWAGNQSSGQLVRKLLSELPNPTSTKELDYFEPSKCISSRFGLDSGPAWTALDAGFSINEHPIGVKASAAVELLAAIGLQRCRPVIHVKGIDYATWKTRLSPALLSVAACGEIVSGSCTKYRTRVIDRGSYAALCHSYPLKGYSRD